MAGAEVVAGLWAAEEVISTGIQASVAGYAIAKPTMPLNATFSQIGSTSDTQSTASLARSHHTLTVIGNRAWIFGGQTAEKQLATDEIHSIALPINGTSETEYQALPSIPVSDGQQTPAARSEHAACAIGKRLAIHGGRSEDGALVDEGSKIWIFDTEQLTWEALEPASHPERTPPARYKGRLLSHGGNLVLYGGVGSDGSALTDVWHFDCSTKVWNQLPHAPVAAASAAVSGDTLYVIAASDSLSSDVHSLDIKLYETQPPTWSTVSVPTNPLTPGPQPRENGGLLPVTTGFGRNFLLYFFGERQADIKNDAKVSTDLWTYQLPSSELQAKMSTEAVKPAKVKDQIRSGLGADTGESSWAEVEVQAPGDPQAQSGKAHPGPRGSFGYDVSQDGKNVVIWGGTSGDGKVEGDGWMITLS
ncbi:hypothetical protein F5Y18DRAFT_415460 [Xylariaceae sp. FL1019]|nr:hypothetical protein F5Y18DRAFT_415460 [Xylariaceae sp. FL1019]